MHIFSKSIPTKVITIMLCVILFNICLYAQDTSSYYKHSYGYFGISMPYATMSSDDFNGMKFQTTESNSQFDGYVFLPFIDYGFGYELIFGVKSESKEGLLSILKASCVELSYIHTNHLAAWIDINSTNSTVSGLEFNAIQSSLDLAMKFYFSNEPFLVYLLYGLPLTSSLTIENGSYRIVNNIPTDYGDVTFHGGLFHSGFLNLRIGIGITYQIFKYMSLDFTYSSRALKYSSFTGIMGERETKQYLSPYSSVTGGVLGSLYVRYTVLEIGLKYNY